MRVWAVWCAGGTPPGRWFTALAVAALASAGCGGPSTPLGPVGDPGGEVLAQLAAVRSAVPATARVERVSRSEPHYTGSCTSTTATIGVAVLFLSSAPLGSLEAAVGRRLAAAGWQLQPGKVPAGQWYATVDGQWQTAENYVWKWRRHVPGRPTQNAQLQVSTTLSGQQPGEQLQWLLGASSAAVDGPRLHCGSG